MAPCRSQRLIDQENKTRRTFQERKQFYEIQDVIVQNIKRAGWRKLCGLEVATGRKVVPEGVSKARVVRRFPKTLRSTTSKGLENFDGVSCYRSSLLQCLLHLPMFYQFLGQIHLNCDQLESRCTTCALQELTQSYWSENPGTSTNIRLTSLSRRLLSALKWAIIHSGVTPTPGSGIKDDLKGDRQSSSFDYARALVEVLEHELGASMRQRLFDLFRYHAILTWTCKSCQKEHVGQPLSTFGIDISIQTRQNATFDEYLDDAFRTQSQRTCENASCVNSGGEKREEQEEHTRIRDAPHIMPVRIQRVYSRLEEGAFLPFKDDKHVRYPEILDLTRFTQDNSDLRYRLEGVIWHRGGPGAGHYIAAARNPDSETFSLMDDRRVTHSNMNIDDVFAKDYDGWDAYTLLYSKDLEA